MESVVYDNKDTTHIKQFSLRLDPALVETSTGDSSGFRFLRDMSFARERAFKPLFYHYIHPYRRCFMWLFQASHYSRQWSSRFANDRVEDRHWRNSCLISSINNIGLTGGSFALITPSLLPLSSQLLQLSDRIHMFLSGSSER